MFNGGLGKTMYCGILTVLIAPQSFGIRTIWLKRWATRSKLFVLITMPS
jgi:hypothetical protein